MKTQKRVINIDKTVYDAAKVYCKLNTLNMGKWIERIVLEKMISKPSIVKEGTMPKYQTI